MDAYQSTSKDITYSDDHPILLVASSNDAMLQAERAIGAFQIRVGARLPVESASDRIATQPSASAVWVELDRDCGSAMDELLAEVARGVSDGRFGAVVSASTSLIDPLSALIAGSDIEFIVDAGESERIAALAGATAQRSLGSAVADAASDRSAERLRQLSEEVSRIASTLARLSTGPSASPRTVEQAPAGDIPPLSIDTVRSVIRARRLRSRYFQEELFADPAWDMLLDLLQAEIAQLRVPVSSLCIAAAVPATTALRWLKTMVSQGIFVRRADPHDGRRVFVELAPDASRALRQYFADVGQVATI